MKNDKLVWDMLMQTINNEYGVAGIMGNLKAESGIYSDNLQNSGNKKLGLSDAEYTKKVDEGTISFIDRIGYGIAQWTTNGRKTNLFNFCKSRNKSIGDLETQVLFLLEELKTSYKNTYKIIKNATSVKEASDRFLVYYEAPASKDKDSTKNKRASLGNEYYNKYHTDVAVTTPKDECIVVVVKKGDTLWNLAKKYLGSGYKWNVIKEFNKLTSSTIKVGQVLLIQKGE